jgi:hypothetical protein
MGKIKCEDAKKAIEAFLKSLGGENIPDDEKISLVKGYDRAVRHARKNIEGTTKIVCPECWGHLEEQKKKYCRA